MASALKNTLDLRSFLVLWGAGNSGKTTTLRMLLEEISKKQNSNVVPTAVSSFLSKRQEFRIIIKYQETYIYLSTYGDTLEETQANMSFFDGELKNKRIFVYQPGSSVQLLNKETDYYSIMSPSFCISACRGDGRVPLPLDYYGDKMRIHTSSIVWLHKEKDSAKTHYHNSNRSHAIEICEFIERKNQNKLI